MSLPALHSSSQAIALIGGCSPPQIGKVQDNIRKAGALCEVLSPGSVDLVCFPEMIFTGYVFPDAASISPFLEEPRTGPTSRFCAALAARLRCYVVAGYPERLGAHEILRPVDGASKVGANSAILYGPTGEFSGGYRKTNLYETDLTWAQAGTGFATFHLPPPLNTVSVGICMDLNPQSTPWDLEAGPFELADYCIEQRTDLLVLLNAWLASDDEEQEDEKEDWSTLNYWAQRLRPLWAKGTTMPVKDDGRSSGKQTTVVVCNRCGEENGKTFAGSSSIFKLTRGAGRPGLLDAMGRQEEGISVWTVQR